MAIKDPYLIEQENRQPETSPPTMASVGEVDYANGGLTLIFPGADGPSSKRYQCNTAVKFVPGQRVKIDPISGSFVVAYPIGPPAEKIVADAADSIGGYSPKADAETGALYFVDKDNTAVAVLYAQTAQQANTALEAEMALDSQKLNGQTAEELEVARALEADTALEAERAKDADKLGGKTEAQLQVSRAQTAGTATYANGTQADRFRLPNGSIGSATQYLDFVCSDQALAFSAIDGYWWFRPETDNLVNLGRGPGNHKWRQLYANIGEINTSDREKKKYIKAVGDKYLDLYWRLQPVTYKLRSSGADQHDRTHLGFIAQDVEKALEETGLTAMDLAAFCKDQRLDKHGHPVEGAYDYALRYTELVALNTAAVHSLRRTIEAQQSQIDALAARLAEWEAKHEQTDL